MCLISSEMYPQQAKEDITCYKVLFRLFDGKYYTPYFFDCVSSNTDNLSGVTHTAGTTIQLERCTISTSVVMKVGDGFIHTYKTYTEAESDLEYLTNHYSKEMLRIDFEICLFECYIPKGCYFYDGTSTYASDEIIYRENLVTNGKRMEEKDYFKTLIHWVYYPGYFDDMDLKHTEVFEKIWKYYYPEFNTVNRHNYGWLLRQSLTDGAHNAIHRFIMNNVSSKVENNADYVVLLEMCEIIKSLTIKECDKILSAPIENFINDIQIFINSVEWKDIKKTIYCCPLTTHAQGYIEKICQKPIDVVNILCANQDRKTYKYAFSTEYKVLLGLAKRVHLLLIEKIR